MEPDSLTPEQALARIADVARIQTSLRSRLEGMTWVLWGLVAALQAMTLALLDAASLDGWLGSRHVAGVGSHVWIAVGVVASVGVWRAAAVSFDPGVSRPRALAFFVGWPLVFALTAYLVRDLGGDAFRFALVTGLLLLAFAVVNPLRYTRRGRLTAGALAACAFLLAAFSWTAPLAGESWYVVVGTAVGMSWVLAGLDALYRG